MTFEYRPRLNPAQMTKEDRQKLDEQERSQVAKLVKSAIKLRGLDQKDYASLEGITPGTLSKKLKVAGFPARDLIRLTKVLDLKITIDRGVCSISE